MKKYTIALLVAICAFAAVDLNAAPKLLSGKTKTRRMSIAEFNYMKLDAEYLAHFRKIEN